MSNIEITRPNPETGSDTLVVIDGTDLSRSISDISIDLTPAKARVTVELVLVEDHRLCMADAELVIGEGTAEMLEQHGWTRPGVTA